MRWLGRSSFRGAIAGFAFIVSAALAVIINPLPFIFQNGTTIDATQVNADLAQIVNNVNTNVPTLIPTLKAPNIQVFSTGSALTYTTPLNGAALPLYLEVRMIGGGGGGGEGGAAGSGGAGGASTWSGGSLSANGGQPGSNGGLGAAGGTSVNCNVVNMAGQSGGVAEFTVTTGFATVGGQGGNGPFGGGSGLGGTTAITGSGGGGSGGAATSPANGGSGGGAGGYCDHIISPVVSSYTYTVGGGGAASAGGGNHGAAGAAGQIIVVAHWQ